jgi:hypothetical protein
METTMKRLLTFFAVCLLAGLTLIGCGGAAPTTTNSNAGSPSAPPTTSNTAGNAAKPLVTIRAEGGHCINNSCGSEKQINEDGSYVAKYGTGANQAGTLNAAAVAELAELVATTNFEEIKALPFTGTCPIAFDGQEITYIFHTANGDQTIASCKVAIDPNLPIFQQTDTLVAAMTQPS